MILRTKMITTGYFAMILAGLSSGPGHCGKEAVDHVDAERRDVLLEPGGMLGTNRVVVR
jgi:hypothetical protein